MPSLPNARPHVWRRHELKEFNPDEPRDEHGRWTGGGDSGASGQLQFPGMPKLPALVQGGAEPWQLLGANLSFQGDVPYGDRVKQWQAANDYGASHFEIDGQAPPADQGFTPENHNNSGFIGEAFGGSDESQAVNTYMGSAYEPINQALRSGDESGGAEPEETEYEDVDFEGGYDVNGESFKGGFDDHGDPVVGGFDENGQSFKGGYDENGDTPETSATPKENQDPSDFNHDQYGQAEDAIGDNGLPVYGYDGNTSGLVGQFDENGNNQFTGDDNYGNMAYGYDEQGQTQEQAQEAFNELQDEENSNAEIEPETVSNIDKAINEGVVTQPVTVFRGGTNHFGIGLDVGSQYTDAGFVSTSLVATATSGFRSENSIVEIHVPAGAHALWTGSGEGEVILPRNSVFHVDAIDKAPTNSMSVSTTSGENSPPFGSLNVVHATWLGTTDTVSAMKWLRIVERKVAELKKAKPTPPKLPADPKKRFDWEPGDIRVLPPDEHLPVPKGPDTKSRQQKKANPDTDPNQIHYAAHRKRYQMGPEFKDYNPDEPRDADGRWGSGGGGTITEVRPISSDEARGNSRAVSHQEFQALAAEGEQRLRDEVGDSRPMTALNSPEQWSAIKSSAYAAVQESWGGQTINPATGKSYTDTSTQRFALTIHSPGESTISVPEHADQQTFNNAMDEAKAEYGDRLIGAHTYLGVFHDDDNNRIDFDPVIIVDTPHEVESIGAYTHAIGGAYDFSTGDGYFPPHVDESKRRSFERKAATPIATADDDNLYSIGHIHHTTGNRWPHKVEHVQAKAFDPDQPRDADGKWGDGGGETSATPVVHLPKGTTLYHTTRQYRVDQISASGGIPHSSAQGESGPGIYTYANPDYAAKLRTYDPTMVSLKYETTKPLDLLNRDTTDGEALFRSLQQKNGSQTPALVDAIKAAGYDGVAHTSPGETAPEIVIHDPAALRAAGQIKWLQAKEYNPDQPRDPNGEWGDGGGTGAGPKQSDNVHEHTEIENGTEGIHQDPVTFLRNGHDAYMKANNIEPLPPINYDTDTSDPVKFAELAKTFNDAPIIDARALPAYNAYTAEISKQYSYLTRPKSEGGMGVKVDFVDKDPYTDVTGIAHDILENNHLSILSTAATGGHPLLSDEINNEFRAVHDAFGHAATGRGFDKNGEEAAYQSHARMFSPLARGPLASETRAQVAWTITNGRFPDSPKVIYMPPDEIKHRWHRVEFKGDNAGEIGWEWSGNAGSATSGAAEREHIAAVTDHGVLTGRQGMDWLNAGAQQLAGDDAIVTHYPDPKFGGGVQTWADPVKLAGGAKAAVAKDIASRRLPGVSTVDLANAAFGKGAIGNPYTGSAGKTVLIIPGSEGQFSSFTMHEGDPLVKGDITLGTPEADAIIRNGAVASLVQNWAQTSNDSNPRSLAIQEAARQQFGLKNTAIWQGKSGLPLVPEATDPADQKVYQAFLKAQYDATQARFERDGIKSVEVFRGVAPLDDGGGRAPGVGTDSIVTRPLSSWSFSSLTATSFAIGMGHGGNPNSFVAAMRVPASQVFSVPLTGNGCLTESEVVLLGGEFDGVKIIQGPDFSAAQTYPVGVPVAQIKAAGSVPINVDDGDENADWIKFVGPDNGVWGTMVPAGKRIVANKHRWHRVQFKEYNPDQPRDADGKWGDGGGSFSQSKLQELSYSWQRTFRGSAISDMTGPDKDMEMELHRLMVGGPAPKGQSEGVQMAHDFLRAVDENAKPSSGELSRGMAMTESQIYKFQPGEKVDLPISSWSSDNEVAVRFASYSADPDENMGGTKDSQIIVLHVPAGTMAWQIPAFPGLGEAESVTGGRFVVDSYSSGKGVSADSGRTIPVTDVYMHQEQFQAKVARSALLPSWFPADFEVNADLFAPLIRQPSIRPMHPGVAAVRAHPDFPKSRQFKDYNEDEPRDNTGEWSSGGGGAGSPAEVAQVADSIHAAAVKAEPAVKADLADAAKGADATLVGLQFDVKTPESLQAKISDKMTELGTTDPKVAGETIHDELRFTMEAPPQEYSDMVKGAVQELQAKGYSFAPDRFKNTWAPGSPYRGINATLYAPSGQDIELQFHTQQSFDTKMGSHELYKQLLDPSITPEREQQLNAQMAANAAAITMPPGALTLTAQNLGLK